MTPQHKYKQSHAPASTLPVFQRTSSTFRLSRTSTNTNANTNYDTLDNQSLRTLDRIPSSKPSITYSDKLWTQIDVLDDVRNMSGQVRDKGSFFNDKFNEELNKLKLSQEKLIEVMANQQFKNVSFEKSKQRVKPGASHSESDNNSDAEEDADTSKQKQRQDKFKDFFGPKKRGGSHVVYKKQNFDDMNSYIHDVRQSLKEVSESMKNFDSTTRDLW